MYSIRSAIKMAYTVWDQLHTHTMDLMKLEVVFNFSFQNVLNIPKSLL